MGIQQDISNEIQSKTQIIQAKEIAEKATKSKSEFLANMSHEIRTPMNGVLGMLKLIQKSKGLTRDQLHQINLAQSSAESLLVVINDILDFSKIEAGKINLESIEFDLLECISDISESMAFHAHKKDIDLALDISDISVFRLFGDPNRLRQVISNLVGNAIKFTNDGWVKITLSTESISDHKAKVVCSIEDSGIGIAEDRLEKLFSAFEQADSSTTRQFGGTGLGLTIAKKLCQLMSGDVYVNSTIGEGSCFRFDIYLDYEDPISISQLVDHQFDDKHALIIDANDASVQAMSSTLKQWGLQVQSSKNSGAALKTLEWAQHTKRHFDYIFIDSMLFDVNDKDLLKVTSLSSSSEGSRIILMNKITQNVSEDIVQSELIHYYFPKPATPLDLFRSLNNELEAATTQDPSHLGIQINAQVLLVEDNVINQEIALSILEDLGIIADVADNGRIALEQLQSNDKRYDLILMDCQMPELDGYQTSEAIRNGEAGQDIQQVPIIAMTANAMEGDKEKCLAAGMNDYLSKPIDIDLLANKLSEFLSRSPL